MLQIILLLVVAGTIAYFIATSRKSKVEEVSKSTAPKNPTFDPVVHAPVPVEEISVKTKAIASVQQIEELKEAKKVVKKAAPKKKATK
jgi:hypothetical protein